MNTLSLSVSNPSSGERQQLAHLAQHLGQQPLLAHQQRRALRPARGDVGQHQRLHEAAARRRPAMRHQVRFDEPGRRVLPVREGPHRHAAPHRRRRRRAPAFLAACRVLHRPQRPVDRRRAHRQHAGAHLRRQLQMPVPLHRLHQHRQQRPQPLAADPVRRLPQHDQRLAHRRRRRAGAPAAGPPIAALPCRHGAGASRACGGDPSPPRTRPGSGHARSGPSVRTAPPPPPPVRLASPCSPASSQLPRLVTAGEHFR